MSPVIDGDGVVQAAGGVVWRHAPDGHGVEVLVVHRPRYDDWSLPKGKLDPGEGHAEAALREVEEETGYRCELGRELRSVRYRDNKGRPKVVRYWAMTVVDGDGAFRPDDEVDEIRWVPMARASTAISYQRDVDVVDDFGHRGPGPVP
ncbi:MAG: NUDIX hydrolase [Acidimicrobiales bacterium]